MKIGLSIGVELAEFWFRTAHIYFYFKTFKLFAIKSNFVEIVAQGESSLIKEGNKNPLINKTKNIKNQRE